MLLLEPKRVNLYKFPKAERLHSKSKIEQLFSKGQHFTIFPLKVVYLRQDLKEAGNVNQVLITVPKKNFKRAVDRNLLKRRIREAYRLNKHLITLSGTDFYLLIGYIYVGREVQKYQEIEKKLKLSLLRLNKIVGS